MLWLTRCPCLIVKGGDMLSVNQAPALAGFLDGAELHRLTLPSSHSVCCLHSSNKFRCVYLTLSVFSNAHSE